MADICGAAKNLSSSTANITSYVSGPAEPSLSLHFVVVPDKLMQSCQPEVSLGPTRTTVSRSHDSVHQVDTKAARHVQTTCYAAKAAVCQSFTPYGGSYLADHKTALRECPGCAFHDE